MTFTLGCPAGTTLECAEPQPLLYSNGDATGFVKCEDGAMNRLMPRAVPAPADPAICAGDEPDRYCQSDADCNGGPNGRCVHFDSTTVEWLPRARCDCTYFCTSDDDCGDDRACVASELSGGYGNASCQPARCHGPTDCESDECGLNIEEHLYYYGERASLACRHPGVDTCHGDDACDSGDTCSLVSKRGTDVRECR